MGNAQYTVSASDRSDDTAFTVPGDEDGGAGDDSFPGGFDDDGKRPHYYVHVDNGFDVNADVTLRGSHDTDASMASAVDDGATETVNSDAAAVFDSETAHSYVEVNVNPASNPSTGGLTVTFQSREY